MGKETGLTNRLERFDDTLRQRVSRLVRKSLAFFKKIENHVGAVFCFLNHHKASSPFRDCRVELLISFHDISASQGCCHIMNLVSTRSFGGWPAYHVYSEVVEFYYATAGGGMDRVRGLKLEEQPFADALLSGADIRLAFFQNPLNRDEWIPYWLVWQSQIDLTELDKRVQSGDSSSEDFRSAVRSCCTSTECMQCKNVYATLVVDAGDTYPTAPSLAYAKITAMQVLRCPNCGTGFRCLVAKVLGMR